MVTLTKENVTQALKAAVEARGSDYVYSGDPGRPQDAESVNIACFYVHTNGEPGCIVGWVLNHLGVPLSAIQMVEPTNWSIDADGLILELRAAGEIECFDYTVINLLETVQVKQDLRIPWGTAVEVALKKYE